MHSVRRLRGPVLAAFALLMCAVGSRADAAPAKDVLSVRLVDLRSNGGHVGCALWGSEKGFPKDRSAALQTRWCSITSREARCTFEPIEAGIYAVACFHDENNNGVLDTGLFGIPTEGIVASNEAKGFMGPPSFKKASFAFSKATELSLKMSY